MKEIDFLPEWYRSGRQRQMRYRTQYIALGGIFAVMMVWNLVCICSLSSAKTQLARMAGCEMTFVPAMGGRVPKHDENQQTTVKNIYVAGDVAGIEEASTAIVEGRLAGLAVAHSLGYLSDSEFEAKRGEQLHSMIGLRSGPFGDKRRLGKEIMMSVGEG